MRKLIVAKNAGFCFGVKRAVDMVYDSLDKYDKVATLGHIIHNNQIVDELKQKGVRVIDDFKDNDKNETIILRAHGVTKDIVEYYSLTNTNYLDATCPFVTKIQKIVMQQSEKPNVVIIIFGKYDHPEVRSISSYVNKGTPFFIVDNENSLVSVLKDNNNFLNKQIVMVAQTTANKDIYEKCTNIIMAICEKNRFFSTICSATAIRQHEAVQLANMCDIIVVVGGRHSSNTAKLRDICKNICETILVEAAQELFLFDFYKYSKIGLTAGASTPSRIIKEVQTVMSEILNKIEDDDISFEEGLEQTLQIVTNGDKVVGIVTEVGDNEVQVDIGTKHAGYIPLNELTDDITKSPKDLVKVDDKIDLMVIRVNDVEGTVMLSKKRLDAIAGFDKILEAEKNDTILEGVVTKVVRGGVIAVTNSTKVFIPASQATASRNDNLEDLLKQKVRFKIIETNLSRRRAVGSIRKVVKEEREEQSKSFWENVELNKEYKGEVKSLTNYGAFVDLGGVDGMIHISELSWLRIKHPSDVVKIGDIVDVYVKELDKDKHRISLGYKRVDSNPWEVFRREYNIGDTITAKIVSITNFGAFANIIPGVDGLIHISQISKDHIEKPEDVLKIGQQVDVKITDVDFEGKRISLSMRALEENDSPSEDEAISTDSEVVYEAGPDSSSGSFELEENTKELDNEEIE